MLQRRGFDACEIDFEGKFWMDYDWAARFGGLAHEAGIVLSVHAPIAGFMRVTSPAMASAAIRGASEAGAEVLELGLVGTEMVYFAVGELGLDGGIAVTASHNPKQYTGMKIVRRGALPVGGDSGLLDIRDRAMSLSDPPEGLTPGHVEHYDIWDEYVERVLSFVDLEAIRPLKVVIDAANGMGFPLCRLPGPFHRGRAKANLGSST